MLKDLPVFFIVFLGLLSVKRAVVHNEIETALEVLCSSKLNFQILEINFQHIKHPALKFSCDVGNTPHFFPPWFCIVVKQYLPYSSPANCHAFPVYFLG